MSNLAPDEVLARKLEAFFVLSVLVFVGLLVIAYPTKHLEVADWPTVDWEHAADEQSKTLAISWAGNPKFPAASDHTWIQRRLESVFNVRFVPVFLDNSGYLNRRPLMMTGGTVPDVNWDGDPQVLRKYIQQGLVLEIPYRILRKYAPTYVANLNRYGKEGWLYSRFGGRNWGIPTYAYVDRYPYPSAWRSDWLAKVGITRVPETLDEMHEAMVRIRRQLKDKTGIQDKRGMCPAPHWAVGLVDVFAAFDLLPQDFIVRHGRVVWGGIQPEAKRVLGILRHWYSDGLIDPDFATANLNDSPASGKFLNGVTAYYFEWLGFQDFDRSDPNSITSLLSKLNPGASMTPAKPLLGVDGKRHARVWGGPAHVVWFSVNLAKRPDKIIRTLRILERLATDKQLYVESRLGKRGMHWEYSADHGVSFLGEYNTKGAAAKNLLTKDVDGAYGFFSPCAAPPDFTKDLLPTSAGPFRQEYSRPEWGIENAIGKSDVTPSSADYLEDLHQFQTTAYVSIIRGDRPLDYFESFVAEWRARGGDMITKEANEIYRQRPYIFREVGASQ